MHSLNRVKKIYDLETLKKDWFFKLINKFIKQQGLYGKIMNLPPHLMRKIICTMHSNNYCISKLFVRTISSSIPSVVLGRSAAIYNLLWIKYIMKHINLVPEDIKSIIWEQNGLTIEEWIKIETKKQL